jgi:uncharacterized protein
MKLDRATLCLPIADRAVSHGFYTRVGFSAVGEPGEDGLPEPLQIDVSDGLRVMLIPTGGFGWVIGGREQTPSGTHECLIAVGLPSERDVDELMRRAEDAGAEIVYPAASQSWGPGDHVDAYAGVFSDPDGHLWQISRDDGVLTG